MAVTYFGYPASGDDPGSVTDGYNYANYTFANSALIFTCPGSGNQNISALSAWIKASAGGGNFRMAVYSTDLATLYAEHSAEINVPSTWSAYAWRGDSQGITQSSPIVGGSNYAIVISFDASDPRLGYNSGSTGDTVYKTNYDKTGGYSGALSLTTNLSRKYCVRCGVEPLATGVTITQLERGIRGMCRGMNYHFYGMLARMLQGCEMRFRPVVWEQITKGRFGSYERLMRIAYALPA